MPNVTGLKITGALWAVASIGHTVGQRHSIPVHLEMHIHGVLIQVAPKLKAQGFMNDPQFKRLPRLVAACARAGWYQGITLF
jgi:hypothetical protein